MSGGVRKRARFNIRRPSAIERVSSSRLCSCHFLPFLCSLDKYSESDIFSVEFGLDRILHVGRLIFECAVIIIIIIIINNNNMGEVSVHIPVLSKT